MKLKKEENLIDIDKYKMRIIYSKYINNTYHVFLKK